MTAIHARANEIIDLRSTSGPWPRTASVFEGTSLEVIRMELPAGKRIPQHAAPGDVLIHCLEGKLTMTALGRTQELSAGQLVYLPAHEPHSLAAIEDVVLLLTIAARTAQASDDADLVDEASRESFPASDSPAH